MHRHRKPVRKCVGCGLNFRDYCGVYDTPREMWTRGHCPGYKNADLLAEYERRETSRNATPHDRHRDIQKLRATEPHYQGRRDPRHRTRHERSA